MTVPYFIQTTKDIPAEVQFCQITPQAGGGYIVDAWACYDGRRGSHRPERLLRPAPQDDGDSTDHDDVLTRE